MLRKTLQQMTRSRQERCCDIFKVSCDIKFKIKHSKAGTMSQQRSFMSRQQHVVVRYFVVTWEKIVTTKVEKNPRKNVAAESSMLHKDEELKVKIFVATTESYVAT